MGSDGLTDTLTGASGSVVVLGDEVEYLGPVVLLQVTVDVRVDVGVYQESCAVIEFVAIDGR